MTLQVLSPDAERLQRALKERDALRKRYNQERRAAIQRDLKRFSHGEELKHLVRFASKLAPTEGKRLVDAVRRAEWLTGAAVHKDFRYLALSLLGRAIVVRREREGLAPFDDPMPPKLNAFFAIRDLLRVS